MELQLIVERHKYLIFNTLKCEWNKTQMTLDLSSDIES